MEGTKSSSNIKTLIILGYLLVVSVMIIGLITIYNNLVEFSEKRVRDEDRSELIIVGNTISKLYEVENTKDLSSVDMAENYFFKFDSIQPYINQNLDSLKTFSSDSSRIQTLDSIIILLDDKNRNLKEIAALLDSIQKSPILEKKYESTFIPKVLNEDIQDYLKKNNLKQPEVLANNDTTVLRGEKKGFFSRIRDAVVGKTDSTIVVEKGNKKSEVDIKLVVDTIVNMVRYSEKLNLDMQRKFQRLLYQRQVGLNNMNESLTSRIEHLLNTIEEEEYAKYLLLVANRDSMLLSSQRTIYWATVIAAIIATIFGIIALVFINHNYRYRRRLEESNTRISDLLESRQKLMLTISHDIKAPMSSILGYTELLDADITQEKKELYLSNMRKSGEHILQLIANLLNYHKLESGTWTLKEINFNVHDLIEDTAQSFEPAAKRKKLSYTIENNVSANLSTLGDAYVIRQIFSNILSNAIKYTSSGSITVKANISTKNESNHLIFSVKDTGFGIDDEEQKIIFQEFRQLDSVNPDLFEEGSGLGLAITRGLVEELNGEINLDSKKGVGSEFIITLPLKKGIVTQIVAEKKNEIKNNYNFSSLKALLVDDDPIQLTMASEILKLKNIRVTTETDPENVVALLKKNVFDIIFVDIQMPQMSGFELVEIVRHCGLEYCENVPIIIISAKNLPPVSSENDLYTDFLPKPFASDDLYELIHKHIDSESTDLKINKTEKKDDNKIKGVENLIEFVKEDKQASLEILNTFISEIEKNIDDFETAYQEDNLLEAGRLAHKMLPLFQMMHDEIIVNVFGLLEKNKPATSNEVENAISRSRQHVSTAKALKLKIERS